MYDVAVLGGGPGGYVAAIRASQLGGKVCLIEQDRVGGTCLNRGCIPTKSILACTELLGHIKSAAEFGIDVEKFSVNMDKIIDRKDEIVTELTGGIEMLLKSYKVDLISGSGKLTAADTIEITSADETRSVQAKNIILATGSEPAMIPAFGIDREKVITSDEALNLRKLPKSILIIGGGVIGSEFACIFSELGVAVEMVELLPGILPTEDKSIGRRMQMSFKKRGIKINTGVKIEKVEKTADGIIAHLEGGKSITADMCLVSIGRSLNTKNIGLEEVGVLTERGAVIVDDRLNTSVPGIFAIGDITAKLMLAHVASAQGLVAAANAMGQEEKIDYRVVPACIFTHPEIASVGLTESQAKSEGYQVVTGSFMFRALGKAKAMGQVEGQVKLVADAETDLLLGAQMMGPHVTDLIAEAALAIKSNITVANLINTIHAHPTLAEAVLEAAEDIHNMSPHTPNKRKRK